MIYLRKIITKHEQNAVHVENFEKFIISIPNWTGINLPTGNIFGNICFVHIVSHAQHPSSIANTTKPQCNANIALYQSSLTLIWCHIGIKAKTKHKKMLSNPNAHWATWASIGHSINFKNHVRIKRKSFFRSENFLNKLELSCAKLRPA